MDCIIRRDASTGLCLQPCEDGSDCSGQGPVPEECVVFGEDDGGDRTYCVGGPANCAAQAQDSP